MHKENIMAGRPERIIIEITTGDNGTHRVDYEYVPVTSEYTPIDQQAALELAIYSMVDKAIQMRVVQGQRVPAAFLVVKEAETYREFFF